MDPFHAEKHTMPKCDIRDQDCKYHPDLDIYKDVRNMNMEVCEQTFHLINPLKHISRNMTYAKRLCLLKIVDHDWAYCILRNICILRSKSATSCPVFCATIFREICILRNKIYCILRKHFRSMLYFAQLISCILRNISHT